MGFLPESVLGRAGKHLLSLLRETPVIRYSEHFYDGTEETHQKLMEALSLDDEWYSPELLIDVAASQLKDMELVELLWLEEEMADGEQDYQISLTNTGQELVAKGKLPTFHGVET